MIKKILILFLVVLILGSLVFSYFFFTQKNQTPGETPKDRLSFLPFGDIFGSNPSGTENTPNTETPSTEELPVNRSVLQQLSTETVAGALWFKKEREVPEERRLIFTPVDASTLPKMALGFEGKEVALLENTLTLLLKKEIGDSEKTVFDIDTKNLIIAYQKSVGVSANGSIGKILLQK